MLLAAASAAGKKQVRFGFHPAWMDGVQHEAQFIDSDCRINVGDGRIWSPCKKSSAYADAFDVADARRVVRGKWPIRWRSGSVVQSATIAASVPDGRRNAA